jgi:hypothetical protein
MFNRVLSVAQIMYLLLYFDHLPCVDFSTTSHWSLSTNSAFGERELHFSKIQRLLFTGLLFLTKFSVICIWVGLNLKKQGDTTIPEKLLQKEVGTEKN